MNIKRLKNGDNELIKMKLKMKLKENKNENKIFKNGGNSDIN